MYIWLLCKKKLYFQCFVLSFLKSKTDPNGRNKLMEFWPDLNIYLFLITLVTIGVHVTLCKLFKYLKIMLIQSWSWRAK